MISEELLNNYQKALQQKYNAVCFDIDGTLTEDNSTKIDSRVLPMLANMLKKHIPVVFITGRGETGLSDLLKDILYEPIIRSVFDKPDGKTFTYETPYSDHENILIVGEYFGYNSNLFAINVSDPKFDFPFNDILK